MAGMDPLIQELLGPSAEILPASTGLDMVPAGGVAAPAGTSPMAAGVSYDASDQLEKLANWRPSYRSADSDLLREKNLLDARSRDVTRNDGYVSSAAAITKDNIVGQTYLLNAHPVSTILFGKRDEVWEREFQEEVETKFTLAAESPQNWMDASRHNTLTELVRLAVGVDMMGGEVLATAEWMPSSEFRPFRTALQFIDADRLSTPSTAMADSNIRNGVERNKFGAPIAYHIRLAHPSDAAFNGVSLDSYSWRRVAARKPWGRQMVLHLFEQMRPDQTRGVAAMASALTEMRMTKRFRQTELERAIIAATYAASIETELPNEAVYQAMGGEADANPTVAWSTDYLAAVAAFSGGARNMTLNGARIPMFFPGTSLKIQNPGAQSPVGDKFEQSLLRYTAATLGLSYEQFSKDFSQVNYSGFRGALGETRRAMASRKKRVADGCANFGYRLWLEEAINENSLETLKRANIPAFYDGLNAEAYASADWIGAGEVLIDPLKETQADVLAIREGLMTKEQAIARRSGMDWRKVAEQQKRERELDESLGNPSIYNRPDTPQDNALSGSPQDVQA